MNNKVLVVEDDDLLRPMYALVLEKAGLEVDSVNTGTAAIEYLTQNEKPAIVVLDVNLPGDSNGLKVAQFMRETENLTNTRIIMLTGNPNAIGTDEADKVDLVLMKPVNIHELTTMAKRLMPKPPTPIMPKSTTSIHSAQHLSL